MTKVNKLTEEEHELLLLILDAYDDKYRILHDLYLVIGRDATDKLLEYFKGQTVLFPSEHVVDYVLDHIKGYIRYDVEGKTWHEVLAELYGPDYTTQQSRSLRNYMRRIREKLRYLDIDIKGVELKKWK